MVTLLAMLLTQTPQPRLFLQPNMARQRPSSGVVPDAGVPVFEFAPPNTGAGMGAACACTNPTGSQGEVMTFTRASSGTCLKGLDTTGIANGDLVTCGTNEPRVMYGTTTTGGLGLLVEPVGTNDALYSEAFDNVAWEDQIFGGVAAITRTANAAVAPDGATTAERLQIPAVASGQYSLIAQTSLVGVSRAASVFVKGNGESGTIWVIAAANGGSTSCGPCSYNSSTWTRCTSPLNTDSTTAIYIGVDQVNCVTSNQGAKDVFVWGAQIETRAVSSYIKTTSAAATRAVDVGYLTFTMPAEAAFSMANTTQIGTKPPDYAEVAGTLYKDANNLYTAYGDVAGSVPWNVTALYYIGGVAKFAGTGTPALPTPLSAASRFVLTYPGGTDATVCVAGTCRALTGTAFTPLSGTMRYYVGTYYSANFEVGGVVKGVCVDAPSTTRCQ